MTRRLQGLAFTLCPNQWRGENLWRIPLPKQKPGVRCHCQCHVLSKIIGLFPCRGLSFVLWNILHVLSVVREAGVNTLQGESSGSQILYFSWKPPMSAWRTFSFKMWVGRNQLANIFVKHLKPRLGDSVGLLNQQTFFAVMQVAVTRSIYAWVKWCQSLNKTHCSSIIMFFFMLRHLCQRPITLRTGNFSCVTSKQDTPKHRGLPCPALAVCTPSGAGSLCRPWIIWTAIFWCFSLSQALRNVLFHVPLGGTWGTWQSLGFIHYAWAASPELVLF